MKSKALTAVALFLAVAVFSSAQFQGKIEGTVKDSEGNPLKDVAVTITSTRYENIQFKLKSNEDGNFAQVGLRPGYYQLSFQKQGFQTGSMEVRVDVAESRKVEAVLKTPEKAMEKILSEADKSFVRGNKLLEAADYTGAIAAYEEAVGKNPEEWRYHFNLGLAYKKAGDAANSLAAFCKSAQLNSEIVSSQMEVGEALAKSGRYEEARPYFERAAELSPNDADALYNLGVVLTNLGEAEAALETFHKVVAVEDDYAEAYYQIGTLSIGQNRVQDAVHNLEKFLELAPDDDKAPTARQLLDYLKK